MKKKRLMLSVLGGLLFAGCAVEQHVSTVDNICISGSDTAAAMKASETVLSKMQFSIDKTDAALGVIITRPLEGAQFFEFWRSDNTGSFNKTEANVHTIRRTAQVNITQQDGKTCIACSVNTERLSLPEQRISSTGRTYALFSKSRPSMQRLVLHPEQKAEMTWVKIGRDNSLETEILKRIEKNLIQNERPL